MIPGLLLCWVLTGDGNLGTQLKGAAGRDPGKTVVRIVQLELDQGTRDTLEWVVEREYIGSFAPPGPPAIAEYARLTATEAAKLSKSPKRERKLTVGSLGPSEFNGVQGEHRDYFKVLARRNGDKSLSITLEVERKSNDSGSSTNRCKMATKRLVNGSALLVRPSFAHYCVVIIDYGAQ